MAKHKEEKTNVMRLLDQAGVEYRSHRYGEGEALSGSEVAAIIGKPEYEVFKTLVTRGRSGRIHVFVIPCCCELDLKKAAAAADEKSIEMVKSRELLPLTGYIHGGCSPIGMKRLYPTAVDETAELLDTFTFSAGRIGFQVEMAPEDLRKLIPFTYRDLT